MREFTSNNWPSIRMPVRLPEGIVSGWDKAAPAKPRSRPADKKAELLRIMTYPGNPIWD
jgi:hypothetical protein